MVLETKTLKSPRCLGSRVNPTRVHLLGRELGGRGRITHIYKWSSVYDTLHRHINTRHQMDRSRPPPRRYYHRHEQRRPPLRYAPLRYWPLRYINDLLYMIHYIGTSIPDTRWIDQGLDIHTNDLLYMIHYIGKTRHQMDRSRSKYTYT